MKTVKIQKSDLEEAIEQMAYRLYGEDRSKKVQLHVFENGSITVSNSMDYNMETLWHTGCAPVFTFEERCEYCDGDETEEEKSETINNWTAYIQDAFREAASYLDDYEITVEE